MTTTQHTPGPWEVKRDRRGTMMPFVVEHAPSGRLAHHRNGQAKRVTRFASAEAAALKASELNEDAARQEQLERIKEEAPAMLDALRLVCDFLAVKLDEGQACIIEDEVNAILAKIDGGAA